MEKEKTLVDKATVYEVSFILLPSLAQEQVPAKTSALRDMMIFAGGEVLSFEEPILIDLAYPMVKVDSTGRTKVDSGYFGWIKFEISSEGVEKIKNNLDNDSQVVRYLLVKTVKENTLLSGKMNLQKEEKVRREEEEAPVGEEEVKEASPEEMDKSIDELVVE